MLKLSKNTKDVLNKMRVIDNKPSKIKLNKNVQDVINKMNALDGTQKGRELSKKANEEADRDMGCPYC